MLTPERRAAVLGGLAALVLATSSQGADDDPVATAEVSAAHTSVLGPWYDAVDTAGQAPATVVVLGDSVSEGYGISDDVHLRWVDLLQDALREQSGVAGCPTGPGGYHGTTSLVPAWYAAPSLPDPEVAGSAAEVDSVGPGGRALALRHGASVSWRAEATEVAIGYRTGPGGGRMRIDVDGVPALAGADVDTSSPRRERTVWHSATLDRRARTYTVTHLGGGPVVVTDLTPYRGDRDRCVHVYDASHSGISAESVSRRPDYVADAVSTNPDLVVLALGFNDARAGRSPEQLGRSLSRIINRVRVSGYGGPVLLVSWHRPSAGFFSVPWWQYRDAIRASAGGRGVTFTDIGQAMPAVSSAQAGTYLDPLHPGLLGQQLIAVAMTRELTRQVDTAADEAP